MSIATQAKEWVAGHLWEILLIVMLILAGTFILYQMRGALGPVICGLIAAMPFGQMLNMATQACGAVG